MAKLVGLIGTGRGRVGNVVLSKGLNGQTISRAYQPQVHNPNTTGQIQSRAKMIMAGKLSKITPSNLLEGMNGDNKVERRSRFVANIIRYATISGSNQALLAPNRLIFSEGNAYPVDAPGTSLENNLLEVNFEAYAGAKWPADLHALLVIAVVANNRTGGEFIEVKSAMVTKTNLQVSVDVSGPICNLYAVPITITDGANYVDYAKAVTMSDLNAYVSAFDAIKAGILEMRATTYLNSVS